MTTLRPARRARPRPRPRRSSSGTASAASNSAAQVSTVLNVGPHAGRQPRPRGPRPRRRPTGRPSWASAKPSRLARRHCRADVMPATVGLAARARSSTIGSDLVEEPRVDPGRASASRSTVTPRRSAASSWKGRSGVAIADRPRAARRRSSAVELASPGSQLSPRRPCSSERSAFCSDSGNVRPMAIASPTDCICVPSTPVRAGQLLERPARAPW